MTAACKHFTISLCLCVLVKLTFINSASKRNFSFNLLLFESCKNSPAHIHSGQSCLVCSLVQSEETAIQLPGSDGAPDELQSRLGELEDKVKDLEQKVADLFMDNVALTAKLKASQEVERQQQEENASLIEQLVQALKAQVYTCTTGACIV